MSWLDRLKHARFRDVVFFVDSVDATGGYNTVLREYPFQDVPLVFRMGAAAAEVKFSAYVIGDDYLDGLDALRVALDAPGDGVLIHPTAGAMRVWVSGKYSVREAPTTEGGVARLDLTFVRAQAQIYPTAGANTQETAMQRAARLADAGVTEFVAEFDVSRTPAWAVDRVVGRLKAATSGVWGQIKGLTAQLGDYSSTMIGNYQALRDGMNDLVREPRLLADQVKLLFSLPTELSQALVRDFQSAFSWAFTVGSKVDQTDFETVLMPEPGAGFVVYGTGDASALGTDAQTRSELGTLLDASNRLFETLALAAYVDATARLDLAVEPPVVTGGLQLNDAVLDAPISYDDVMAMRQAVHDQANRLMSSSGTPAYLPGTDWYGAVAGAQAAALADLQARSRDLVRLTGYTPQAWMPVWYVSYQLFGTAAYADEIMAMNPHIEHPMLVPPGVLLRVVKHG